MSRKGDATLAEWRKSFTCVIHPHLKLLETLVEMEGRLAAAAGYLDAIDASDRRQAELGTAIGGLAVRYTDKLFDHFGLWDGDAAPPPVNLAQARLFVGNLLADVRQRIELGRIAFGPPEDDDPAPSSAATDLLPDPPADEGDRTAVVDKDTFTVRWRGMVCELKNTREFHLLACLNEKPGRYVPWEELVDKLWPETGAENNTIHKTASKLRTKLKRAGMGALVIQADNRTLALLLPDADLNRG